MGLLATALTCLAMAPGCGGPPVTDAPPSVAAFAISYERSGGLKSMPQRLVIRPGREGMVAIRVGSDSHAIAFRAGVKRIRALQTALERADFATIGTPGTNPGVCADCFFYAIRYRGHEVTFSQVEMPKGLGGIVGQFEKMISVHLPFH
jgi:hypothetical protein